MFPFPKSATATLVLILVGGAQVALPEEVPATQESTCVSRAPGFGDRRDVTCLIAATGSRQYIIFRARFLGSHDDTQLSMSAKLNQQLLECEQGSRTESRFEDGEVTLECRFSIDARTAAMHVLEVGIVWTHAQYDGFAIISK